MPIQIQCENPACKKPLRIKDELIGKRIKCPGCGRVQLVVGAPPIAAAPSRPVAAPPSQPVAAAPSRPATDKEGSRHDVFVSYSHMDTDWVKKEVLPRLQSWRIRYAIDFQDFVAGRPFNQEMQRLVKESLYTLAVLTPNWLNSNFADFEGQLRWAMDRADRQQRVLLLRAADCEPPELYRGLTLVDLAQHGPNAWNALRKALQQPGGSAPLTPFHCELAFAKEYDSHGGETGYEYSFNLAIAATLGGTLAFDSIVFRPHYPCNAPASPRAARTVRLAFTQGGRMIMAFGYQGGELPPAGGTDPDTHEPDPPETIALEPGRGIRLPHLGLGPVAGGVPGRCPAGLSIDLYQGDHCVSQSCWTILPPITRLPQSGAGDGLNIPVLPAQMISPDSGILDHALVETIFQTAGEFAQDHLLVSVHPSLVTVHQMMDGRTLHTVTGWRYCFYSESQGGTFQIDPQDPTWIDANAITKTQTRYEVWLSEHMLASCGLDRNLAYLIALAAGCTASEEGPAGQHLKAIKLDGRWRPAWQLPLTYRGAPAGVLADTGEVVTEAKGVWTKPKFVMWNA